MSEASAAPSPSDTFEVAAQLTLFGFADTPARARIRARSRSWRVWGAVRAQAAGLVLAPAAGLVPPHAPWALGALGVSFLLARRRWRHVFTLEEVAGTCPKCGVPVAARAGMLRARHPIACNGCHHDLTLVIPPAALDGRASE